MKNILLIGPCNDRIRTGQFLAPPLGVYRLASYIERKNLASVDVVDPSRDRSAVSRLLNKKRYDIIGHSILHPTFFNDVEIVFEADIIQPESLSILGGQGAAFNFQSLLEKTPADAVFRGFGEKGLEELIKKGNLSDINSIYYNKNGSIIQNSQSDCNSDQDFIEISLSLDFKKVPYQSYWDCMLKEYDIKHMRLMKNTGMSKTARLMTSNYCPMGCTFCSSTNFLNDACEGKEKLIQLEPANIIELMNRVIDAHPDVESFYFNDDNFISKKKRTLDFCESLKTLDKNYNLMCMGRVDNVDSELLRTMKESGFRIIFYGVETFSSRLAKEINKTRSDDYENIASQAIEETLNLGLTPQISLMLFLPTTEEKDLVITIENTVELMSRGARVTIFPYVEAYSGAEISSGPDLIYTNKIINGSEFSIPSHILPYDKNIRTLSQISLDNKEKRNLTFQKDYGNIIPQPIDSLNLMISIYEIMGKPTSKIMETIKRIIHEKY